MVRDCSDCVSKRAVHGGKPPLPLYPWLRFIAGRLIFRKVSDTSDVTFQNVTGTGSRQWLSFHYRVNNPEGMLRTFAWGLVGSLVGSKLTIVLAGEAHIFVNDEPAINISSLNSRAGYHTSTPIQLTLKRGDANTISFGATGSDGRFTHSLKYVYIC